MYRLETSHMKQTLILLLLLLPKSVFSASSTDVSGTFSKVTGLAITSVSGVGTAWGDFDGDGYPDIYIGTTVNNPSNNGLNQLYRNLRNGTFALVPNTIVPAD